MRPPNAGETPGPQVETSVVFKNDSMEGRVRWQGHKRPSKDTKRVKRTRKNVLRDDSRYGQGVYTIANKPKKKGETTAVTT